MKDEGGDMGPGPERSRYWRLKYTDPAEEAAAQAEQLREIAAATDWHAVMVRSGMDVDETIRWLEAKYSAMWN